jgi:choline-sulfatase
LEDYLELYHRYLRQTYPGREKQSGEAIDRYSKWPYRPFAVDRMMADALKQRLVMPHHNEAGEHTASAEHSLTAWTAGRVVRVLESGPKQPFAITCSILHPHAPLIAPRPYLGMYDPAKMPMPKVLNDVFTPPEKRAIPKVLTLTPDGLGTYASLYYGLVAEVDHWVGRILGALDKAGLAENTLVLFLSDHGEMLGEHSRVSKMVFYEASIRVPLLARLPGRIPGGRKVTAPATGADVAPTILDYCNIGRPPEMHGRSLRAAIENTKPAFETAYTELHPPGGGPEEQRILRSQQWKLAFVSGRPHLYHLSEDPDETRNLLEPRHRRQRWVSESRKLHAAMLARLEQMRSPELDRIRAFSV